MKSLSLILTELINLCSDLDSICNTYDINMVNKSHFISVDVSLDLDLSE